MTVIDREAIKAERSRNLRYKRPALSSLGWDAIVTELSDISEACETVHWYEDNDEDTLLAAMDGNDDELWEFKFAFSGLCAKAEELNDALRDSGMDSETFNDCTVALIGNRYDVIGFDSYQEDYYSLMRFEQELAATDAGKRLMRLTKPEMIATIGQCIGITLAFFDLRQEYDYLRATMDILKDENTSVLQTIRNIERLYDESAKDDFSPYRDSTKALEKALDCIPDRIWIE